MRVEGDREELMTTGDAAWAELCAVLDAADPELPLHDPDSPDWTSRDVYTHFIRMHEGSARAIRFELERGEQYQWSGFDENELNERNVAEDRALSLEDARRRAIEARADYRALVVSLTDEQFEEIGRRHGDDLLGGHYRGHLSYIAAGQDYPPSPLSGCAGRNAHIDGPSGPREARVDRAGCADGRIGWTAAELGSD